MKNSLPTIVLLTLIFLLLMGCTQQAPTATPEPPISSTLAPTKLAPTPTATLALAHAQVAKVFVCSHTGYTFGLGNDNLVTESKCNLQSETIVFTLNDGSQITAKLVIEATNYLVGDLGKVVAQFSRTKTDGQIESGLCSVKDEGTGKDALSVFKLTDQTTVSADCVFSNGTNLHGAYTIYPIPQACAPTTVWESPIPSSLSFSGKGTYVALLAFPGVTNADAVYVNGLNWTEFSLDEGQVMNFTGAQGMILQFGKCSDQDRLAWEKRNLSFSPTQLSVWEHAGVLK